MGKLAVSGNDAAEVASSGALSGTTPTSWFHVKPGRWNFLLSGSMTGTVQLQRSHDGGTTAVAVTSLGAAVSFTGPASEIVEEVERGMLWRLVPNLSAGTPGYRISR